MLISVSIKDPNKTLCVIIIKVIKSMSVENAIPSIDESLMKELLEKRDILENLLAACGSAFGLKGTCRPATIMKQIKKLIRDNARLRLNDEDEKVKDWQIKNLRSENDELRSVKTRI
jgi:hypothetical protein